MREKPLGEEAAARGRARCAGLLGDDVVLGEAVFLFLCMGDYGGLGVRLVGF